MSQMARVLSTECGITQASSQRTRSLARCSSGTPKTIRGVEIITEKWRVISLDAAVTDTARDAAQPPAGDSARGVGAVAAPKIETRNGRYRCGESGIGDGGTAGRSFAAHQRAFFTRSIYQSRVQPTFSGEKCLR